jgi:hypothetical protein
MKVQFIADVPRRKARPALDDVLRRGVDQLAVACAFCTDAGTRLLSRHADRLNRPGSFVVVADEPPTDLVAMGRLDKRIHGHLFLHYGAQSPVELRAGRAIMHSKVFYARAGTECWLWTGSHNLTGCATQGANCEAAILLHGDASEPPFIDALAHLTACRDEAQLFSPQVPGNVGKRAWESVTAVAIHAEARFVPTTPWPWHIKLGVPKADFDWMLVPPAQVFLFLYRKGQLVGGWTKAHPCAAYFGSLTALNFTNLHPEKPGIPADWSAAFATILEDAKGVLQFGPLDRERSVTTQAVVNIQGKVSERDVLLSQEPKSETRIETASPVRLPLDPDMTACFRRASTESGSLVHIPIVGKRTVVRLPEDELRPDEVSRIVEDLGWGPESGTAVAGFERPNGSSEHHPFILRAKWRIRRA